MFATSLSKHVHYSGLSTKCSLDWSIYIFYKFGNTYFRSFGQSFEVLGSFRHSFPKQSNYYSSNLLIPNFNIKEDLQMENKQLICDQLEVCNGTKCICVMAYLYLERHARIQHSARQHFGQV